MGERFSLLVNHEREPRQTATDDDEVLTEVTVLAADLDEDIWTVIDHEDRMVKMVHFDENERWAWVLPAEDIFTED